MDVAVAIGQHVYAPSGVPDAFAKVSSEVLFQFPFTCATDLSGT